MEVKKQRVAIITNIIPSYRYDFYRRILAEKTLEIRIFCQPSISGMKLQTVHDKFNNRVKLLKSFGLAKEKMAWQFLPFVQLYKNFDVLFFYGNPRVLSNVFYTVLFKILGKKVVIWGQAHTASANPKLEKLRLSWWRCFDYLFLYTDQEVAYLKNYGFHKQTLIGMNNGLDQRNIETAKAKWTADRLEAWRLERGIADKILILSCARLELKNRFHLMIPALKRLCQTQPKLLWCVIGEGEQNQSLRDTVEAANLGSNILWLGSIYNENQLAPWFLSSKVLVHPGAIGLSLLHAFGYGLPVITHDDLASHMPEIAALKNDINGVQFVANDPQSLFETLSKVLRDDVTLKRLGQQALQTATTEFNTNIMAQRFIQMVCNACGPATLKNEGDSA